MDMGIVIAPALAPIVGGHMTRYFGWQSNFHLLMLLSCSILVTLLAFFPETHPPKERVGFSGKTILKIYTQLFKNPEFMGNAVISGLVFAGYWVFIATAPYLFIETFGLDEATYSYYCLCGVGAYMVGAWVNRIMVRYFSLNQILAAGLLWMVLLSVLAMGVGFLFPRSPLVISMVAALYTGAMALVFVNTSTRAMQSLPDYSGFSAALLLTCEMAFSSAGAAISSLIFKGTFMSIASLMSLLAFLAFGLYMFMERKRKRKSNYSACHPRIGGDPY
jgi:DHA1 family bicyclomycin/chloramphenicol resistance-like MFS transporter